MKQDASCTFHKLNDIEWEKERISGRFPSGQAHQHKEQ